MAVVGGAWFGFFVLGLIVEVVLVVVVVVNGVEADIVVVVNVGVVPSGSSGGRIPLPGRFFVEKGACQKYLIRVVLGKIKLLLCLKEKSKKRTDNKKMRYITTIFWLKNVILLIIFLSKSRRKQVTLTAANLIFTARAGFCLRAIIPLVAYLDKCDIS